MTAISSVSVESLHSAFSKLSLADGFCGQISSKPLGDNPLRVDELFLTSQPGKVLFQFTTTLLERKWLHLQQRSITRFFNYNLKKGTCFGESMAFILHQRPTAEIKPWCVAARIEAMVFQLFQDLYYDVLYEFNAHRYRIMKERERASQELGQILPRMKKRARLQSSGKMERMRLSHAAQKKPCALSCLKKRCALLSAQIARQEKQLERVQKKREVVLPKCRVWQNVVGNALLAYHLRTLEVLVLCGTTEMQKFYTQLRETLAKAFAREEVSDMVLTLESQCQNVDHVIVIQPKVFRLYDSNVGAVVYPDFPALVDDLFSYVTREHTCGVTIELVGAA